MGWGKRVVGQGVRRMPIQHSTSRQKEGAGGTWLAGWLAHVKNPWKRTKPQEPPHWMGLEKRTVMGSRAVICRGTQWMWPLGWQRCEALSEGCCPAPCPRWLPQ
jgi:hypothetical protein